MAEEFLYRYRDGGNGLLYVGISNDWTRRLREHWREDPWAREVLTVTVERFADRLAVAGAEMNAIRSEHPRYNVQHNSGRGPEPVAAGIDLESLLVMFLLGIAVGYLAYTLTTAAIAVYRDWKAERDEFRAWKKEHVAEFVGVIEPAEPEPLEPPSIAPLKPVVTTGLIAPPRAPVMTSGSASATLLAALIAYKSWQTSPIGLTGTQGAAEQSRGGPA